MLLEKYKCGLYGDGNFLESSLDNGHFITGMIPAGEIHPVSTELLGRDDSRRRNASCFEEISVQG